MDNKIKVEQRENGRHTGTVTGTKDAIEVYINALRPFGVFYETDQGKPFIEIGLLGNYTPQ